MANTRVQRLAATGAPPTWHEGTTLNMTQAHRSQAAADQNALKSLGCYDSLRFEADQQNYTVHRRLVVKVGHTRRLAERLQDRMNSVEGALSATKASMKDLGAAFEAKKAPLQLNSWRQNRRAERPPRELAKDSLEGALQEEHQTLLNAQKLLQRASRKTQQLVLSMEQTLTRLKEDYERKQNSFRIDKQCIESGSSWTTPKLPLGDDPGPQRPQTPSEGAGTCNTAMSTRTARSLASGYTNPFEEAENQRQFETIVLTNKAKKRESQADEIRNQNNELIRHTQVQCTTALKGVEQRLNERAEETLVIAQRIEKVIEVTDAKIAKTKRCLARTVGEIKSFEQPIDVAGVRERLRQTRLGSERVKDEVSDALSTQFASLRKNVSALEQRHKEEKEALEQLEQAKAQLNADLQDKMTALHIERSIMPGAKGVMIRTANATPIMPPADPRSPMSARAPRRQAGLVLRSPNSARGPGSGVACGRGQLVAKVS